MYLQEKLDKMSKEHSKILSILKDKVFFYEALTHLYIEDSQEYLVMCVLKIGKKELHFKYGASPARETAIDYTPVRLLEDGVEVDIMTNMQGFNKPIRFEEDSAPKFLQRLVKALE